MEDISDFDGVSNYMERTVRNVYQPVLFSHHHLTTIILQSVVSLILPSLFTLIPSYFTISIHFLA